MKRFDLRHLKSDFYGRMTELMSKEIAKDEVAIFMFEVGDFSPVQKKCGRSKRERLDADEQPKIQ